MKSQILKRGYVLLFAVLTSALVLGVAAFIVSMARKQFILSAIARESIISYYNADTVQNCIYNSWVLGNYSSISTPTRLACNGGKLTNSEFVISDSRPAGSIAYGTYLFQTTGVYLASGVVSFDSGSVRSCTKFDIWRGKSTKETESGYSGPPTMMTVIEARGYNSCTTSNEPTASSRTIERAVRVTIPY